MRFSHLHGAFSSSENEGASQGGGHGFRQGVGALTEGGREKGHALLIHRYAVPLLQQEKAKVR